MTIMRMMMTIMIIMSLMRMTVMIGKQIIVLMIECYAGEPEEL